MVLTSTSSISHTDIRCQFDIPYASLVASEGRNKERNVACLSGCNSTLAIGKAREETMKILSVCMLLLLVFCCSVKSAAAQRDMDGTPPIVIDKFVAPAVVNTSLVSQTITVTAHVTDDISGVSTVDFLFRPDVDQRQYFIVSATTPISDDIFVGTAELPQNSSQGFWRLHAIFAFDYIANLRVYSISSPETWPPGKDTFINGRSNYCYIPLIKNRSH